MPHVGHFLESDVPKAAYLYNSPLHSKYHMVKYDHGLSIQCTVRCVSDLSAAGLDTRSPFSLSEYRNVFIETIKRAEDDDFSNSKDQEKTVILRLYEAYGGHASVNLLVSDHVLVHKAALANLLEDTEEELPIARYPFPPPFPSSEISLKFRAFEVKTVKLVIAPNASTQ